MKIIALEKETANAAAEQFQPVLKAEASRAWELYRSGVLRELYFRPDQHTAVLVLECDSVVEAAEVLQTLPLVRQGLISFDLIPLEAYTGFERLFA